MAKSDSIHFVRDISLRHASAKWRGPGSWKGNDKRGVSGCLFA